MIPGIGYPYWLPRSAGQWGEDTKPPRCRSSGGYEVGSQLSPFPYRLAPIVVASLRGKPGARRRSQGGNRTPSPSLDTTSQALPDPSGQTRPPAPPCSPSQETCLPPTPPTRRGTPVRYPLTTREDATPQIPSTPPQARHPRSPAKNATLSRPPPKVPALPCMALSSRVFAPSLPRINNGRRLRRARDPSHLARSKGAS